MKTSPLMILVLLPLTLFAAEVKNGDSLATVQAALGEPRGRAQAGRRELLCFDRGEVELTSGVVTRVVLRSAEAQAAFEAKYAANALRVREEQEIRRVQLTAEGEALKAGKLADNLFQSAPLRFQVEFWRNFANQYSTVSCTEQLNLARARLYEQEQAERVQAEEAQRLAALKASESRGRIFYPMYANDSYGYEGEYRERRRQQRLDRDYHERTIHGSNYVRLDSSCRTESEPRLQARHQDWARADHNITRDCRSDAAMPTKGGMLPSNAATNNSLLAAGQNVMAWDGTKMPGGEAAGLYR